MRIEHLVAAIVLLFIGPSACADKAPPARFRDPPPPTLARPLPEQPPPPKSAELSGGSESGTEAPDQRADPPGESESATSD